MIEAFIYYSAPITYLVLGCLTLTLFLSGLINREARTGALCGIFALSFTAHIFSLNALQPSTEYTTMELAIRVLGAVIGFASTISGLVYYGWASTVIESKLVRLAAVLAAVFCITAAFLQAVLLLGVLK